MVLLNLLGLINVVHSSIKMPLLFDFEAVPFFTPLNLIELSFSIVSGGVSKLLSYEGTDIILRLFSPISD
jgi:hypothetical protein